jgi:uncharacterized protein YndB with AHSA1/START domain/DNA-binding transcriptional ArsR family regulator
MDPMAPVFRALSDPSRRLLLDRLFERDGQTLGELCTHLPEMTRFGVMRHLGVLEGAGLVTTRKVGREKRHYLNPIPIRLLADRWIGKFAAPVLGTLTALKDRLEVPAMSGPDHVYSLIIAADAPRVWRAITDGDETERYYYGTRVASDWSTGAKVVYAYPDGSVAADGEVIEIDPPTKLAMTFHAHWDPEIDAEGPVTMTWELEPQGPATKLTVTTAGLREGSRMAEEFSGGIVHIASGLKTYVETGAPMAVGSPG